MQQLTNSGESAIQNLAQRYGVSIDAVRTLLFAVSSGGGQMAQFYHSDLGGGGQWMRGGMTMVGDMFNHGLQSTVNGLCTELSSLLANQQVFLPPPPQDYGNGFISGNNWWPNELGNPSSSGGQNDSRYAYFPSTQRLAILRGGQLSVYDTLDHNIGGVQQQQGGPSGSLSFSSQFGTFTVDSLPLVSGQPPQPAYQEPYREPSYSQPPEPAYQEPQYNQPQFASPPPVYREPSYSQPPSGGAPQSHDEILNALERLASLHQKGVLSDSEFQSKKADLLARL